MEKTFDPSTIEARMRELWEEAGAFRAGRPERAGAKPFSIVIPPPNVTGSLHMGHALNNTLQDILARYHRMRGDDVLWQPGTDHAGIATQMVVERRLMERQQHRRELGRAKFLEEVWAWKAESGGVIVEQLKRLGASCDWSRERFTLDEGLSRAVVKVFVQLYRDGLLYKDKRLVNWDPKLLTAISDLEVQQIEVKGHLWHFKYPVVYHDGQPTGEFITVATTRPETMLGDTAVAVHPEDERYTKLVGKNVRLPLVGRLIPIVADEYSDPEKGTGAVKITPAHDFNDFEVGRRHGLRLINVLDAEGAVTLKDNADFFEHVAPSPELDMTVAALHGLDRNAARARVVAMMEEHELLAEVSDHKHMVPHGDRSGAVLEPRLTDQWYVDAKTLAQPALAAVREGRTNFVPKNWEKTYFDWLENIQPWCVSRQLWWGHRIPAWYGPRKNIDGTIEPLNNFDSNSMTTAEKLKTFVETSEIDAIAAATDYYGCAVRVESNWLDAMAVQFDNNIVTIWRDEDVLDTWFSSALWPFSTLGWPDETKELDRYYPTDVLVTGFDIIFFWVARMMMMGLYFKKEVPFHDVYIHALVRDEKGAKMSKSKGNVIDPLHLINEYGADALRFTLAAMAAQGRDIKLSTQRVEGYRNFATKLWNASRFAEINGCARVAGFDPKNNQITLNRWIVSEAARAFADVAGAIEAYRFNDAAGAAYRFVWNVFCDWYLELAKPLLQGEDGAAKDETRATTAFILDQTYALLHPFMPFITEELWGVKGFEGPARETPLALAQWPDLSGLEDAAAEAEIGWIVDLVSEVRSVRSEMNLPAGAEVPLTLVGADAESRARVTRWDETLRKLARLSQIGFADAAPKSSAQLIVRGVLGAIPLEGVIDFAAEKARLAKETAKLEGEAKKIEAKLGNADFIARAPDEVVEENRERLEETRERIEKLTAAAKRLD
ncbi:valine--tRNA ligase [Methylosinus sporium]|uniref:Valine--tRNA ligase n=1 Tax=Methylosinus sporium TaxID=428 RepID=A0A549SF01_METSR|nr:MULTISPECIES: valine--tRNA ligase [Methylosinus]MBU3888684.1 valine--tRNA ligase [Methylosinus sp. KRF6]TRL27787.1 valine--tRNA ligase [Methylosinus sporium]